MDERTGDNADVRLCLDEMRLSLQYTLEASQALDQKSTVILTVSGLVVTWLVAFQLVDAPSENVIQWWLFGIAFVVYVASVWIGLTGIRPARYHSSIAADWNEMDAKVFDKDERDAILVLLSGYVDAIAHNEDLNRKKAKVLIVSALLLAVSFGLFVVSVSV